MTLIVANVAVGVGRAGLSLLQAAAAAAAAAAADLLGFSQKDKISSELRFCGGKGLGGQGSQGKD